MNIGNVLARRRPPTTNALYSALADGLAAVQVGRTDQAAADDLGWSIGTVSNVRNRKNILSLKLISDAAYHTDCAFIQPLLAHLGGRFVPHHAICTNDTATTHLMQLGVKIAMALDPSSPGGSMVTPGEARAMLSDMDEFQAHMDGWRHLAAADAVQS